MQRWITVRYCAAELRVSNVQLDRILDRIGITTNAMPGKFGHQFPHCVMECVEIRPIVYERAGIVLQIGSRFLENGAIQSLARW
jgi:hypothetical protein